MASVVAAWTKLAVDYAAARGLDVTPRGTDLSRPDHRVPADVDDAVWLAMRALGDADLAIHVAETAVSAASFGIAGYLARASTTVGDALRRAQQFHRLISDAGRLELRWSPASVAVIERPAVDHGPWPRAIAELVIANYLVLARAWTGIAITPLEVWFQHRRPHDTRELERFFGCRVRFEQRDNRIVLDRDAVDLPLVTADLPLTRYLEPWGLGRLEELTGESIVARVHAAVDDELGGGDVAIGHVARRLGMTARSVQRGLRAEGTTYRDLVDRVRRTRALALVQRGIAIGRVAGEVGFSEPRAFRRAFRRWTGVVPSTFRADPPADD